MVYCGCDIFLFSTFRIYSFENMKLKLSDLSRQLTMAASLLREGNDDEFDRLRDFLSGNADQVRIID